MRVGIDADGVLADFDKSMVDGYNKKFGTDIKYKEITHWDAFQDLTGWDHEQWWDWVVREHPRVFLDAPPLPGAIEGLNALREAGHQICVITAKPQWAAGHMAEWMHDNKAPYDEIHVTKAKSYVICDVYVDDALHNVIDLMENTDALVIQYSAWPYVNGGEVVDGASHATSWEETLWYIRQNEQRNLL